MPAIMAGTRGPCEIPRSRFSRIGLAGRLFFETAAQLKPELPLPRFSLDFGSVDYMVENECSRQPTQADKAEFNRCSKIENRSSEIGLIRK